MPLGFLTDFLFGDDVDSSVETVDRLSPEQNTALNQLLSLLGGRLGLGEDEEGGDPQGQEQQLPFQNLLGLSLTGLESLSEQLPGLGQGPPQFQAGTPPAGQAGQAPGPPAGLGDLFGGQGFEGFFDTTVQNPLLDQFQSEILPGISRQFGGNSFFDSDRGSADARAQDELLSQLAQTRAGLGYRAALDQHQAGLDTHRAGLDAHALNLRGDELGINRYLAGLQGGRLGLDTYLGGLQGLNTQGNLLSTLLGGYSTLTGLAQGQQGLQQGQDSETIKQLLLALGIPTTENIGFQGHDDPGAIGPLGSILALLL